MKANFEKCLKVVLAFEGGYVNHPKDPGRATNFGVTQRVYDSYRSQVGKPAQAVKKISQAEVRAIYREQYWDVVHGDRLPVGVDLAVFDYAVNSGTSRAVRALQKVLNDPGLSPPSGGVKQDGQLGMNTEEAVQKAALTDEVRLITLYCEDRWAFVRKLSTFKIFGKGWQRRIQGRRLGAQEGDNGVIDIAVAMAVADTPAVIDKMVKKLDVPEAEQGGKARTEDVKLQATPEGTATGTASIGGAGVAVAKTGVAAWIGDQVVSLGEFAGFTKDQIEPYISYSSYIMYAFLGLGILGIVGMVTVRMKKRAEGTVEA